MRRQIRELISAAKQRWVERSQSADWKMELPAAVFSRRKRAAPKSRKAWLDSIHGFVTHHLGFPASTLNPGTSFCIRRRGGAKASAG